MKKIIAILFLSLSIGACTQLKAIETAFQLGTASITNPVTKDRLNEIESAVTLVFVGLESWKHSCQQGLIPPMCKSQIGEVQIYTRQLPPYLAQLRSFVKKNDQVNASIVFNNIVSLVGTVKTQAANGGVIIATGVQ